MWVRVYTQRNLFEILLNKTGIRLYLPYLDWFGTKRTSVWFKINRKMVNTIWFQVDLIRFQKDFSVCTHLSQCLCWWWRRVLWGPGQRKPWRRDLQNYRKSSHWQQPRAGQSCHSEIKPILVKNKKNYQERKDTRIECKSYHSENMIIY